MFSGFLFHRIRDFIFLPRFGVFRCLFSVYTRNRGLSGPILKGYTHVYTEHLENTILLISIAEPYYKNIRHISNLYNERRKGKTV